MNALLQTPSWLLVSFETEELNGICNALNEVCHGVHIDDEEFETRLGATREFLADLLHRLREGVTDATLRSYQRSDAWVDGSSIQALCITASGDPADMNPDEAGAFAEKLHEAIQGLS